MARRMNKTDDYHRSKQTNIRLTERDRALLDALAADWGLSLNDVVMLLVRAEAKRRGIAER